MRPIGALYTYMDWSYMSHCGAVYLFLCKGGYTGLNLELQGLHYLLN